MGCPLECDIENVSYDSNKYIGIYGIEFMRNYNCEDKMRIIFSPSLRHHSSLIFNQLQRVRGLFSYFATKKALMSYGRKKER